MNALRCVLAFTLLVLLTGCKGVTVVGSGYPEPLPPPAGETGRYPDAQPSQQPGHYPDRRSHRHDPYAHMVKRQSYTTMASTELKEGCYVGNFKLGRVQLRVNGQGLDKTVINGDLVLQTQCKVSDLTVTGNVIFEGHQAELSNVDFYGQVIDKGSQNRY